MNAEALEGLAWRAVELEVQGRDDPRLLVITRPRVAGHRKVARLVAAAANTAQGRTAMLVFGLDGREIVGLEAPPEPLFWRRVLNALPGAVPQLTMTTLAIGTANVIVIHVEAPGELVPAWRRGLVEVPFVVDGKLRLTPPPPTRPSASVSEVLPSFVLLSGWVERSPVPGRAGIVAYRGILEVELGASDGELRDRDCSATLLVADDTPPVGLDVRLHPSSTDVGVRRTEHGLVVASSFRARLYLAGAHPTTEPTNRTVSTDRPSAQIVVSLLLPGRTGPEMTTSFLTADPDTPDRWVAGS